ncbi:MAG: phage holin family protein [Pseudomonadota bacterium]
MANTSIKLKRLAEVEMLRAEIKARRAGRRLLISGVGLVAGVFALVFLTYGIFLWGAERFGAISTAMSIGSTLLAIAICAIAVALVGPGRSEEIESELVKHAIDKARNDLQRDIDALEDRFERVSSGLANLIDGRKAGESNGAGGNINLAAITMVLSAAGAMSPTLNRYIQPILKIIS